MPSLRAYQKTSDKWRPLTEAQATAYARDLVKRARKLLPEYKEDIAGAERVTKRYIRNAVNEGIVLTRAAIDATFVDYAKGYR